VDFGPPPKLRVTPDPSEKIVLYRCPLLALLLCSLLAVSADDKHPTPPAAQPKPSAPETPLSADKRLVVEAFAVAPDIVQPIALDFDAKGRLLVVESHTHFRPANYTGPKFDRIRILEDTDVDGKADKFTTFYEGTTHTMDLAVHPDGSVYLATRNEIIRLRDTDGDGKADERTRIVFLDTKGNYPHNGLAGLSFDSRGDLNFGIGENLGEPYKLIGTDGAALTGGGEGGNIFHCTADGKKLRRVATGFWNPFGSCRDIYGRLFVVDNDPDASPPCRLLHVVEGGDYGFQFRYGRAGRHPFQAWNGELPGTLPYVAGTGESPCEVISYESDGLPDEYRGELLIPAWADHRVERYTPSLYKSQSTQQKPPADPERGWQELQRITGSENDSVDLSKLPPKIAATLKKWSDSAGIVPLPNGVSMTKKQYMELMAVNDSIRNSPDGLGSARLMAERKPFIQGGKDFYPSGLTVAPDGSLFVSDWGSRSYELHGKGAIWHIKWKDAKRSKRPLEPKEALLSPDRKTRESAAWELMKSKEGREYLSKQLSAPDVRVRATALTTLSSSGSAPPQTLIKVATNDPQMQLRETAVRALVADGVNPSQMRREANELVGFRNPPAVRAAALAGIEDKELLEDLLLKFLTSQDPYLRHAGIMRLARSPQLLEDVTTSINKANARVSLLLAWRASGHKDATKQIPRFLKDPDPEMRFLAIKWVSDEKLTEFRPQITEMMKSTTLDPRSFIALATTLARLDDKPVNDDNLAAYFLQRLNDRDGPLPARLMALRAIPATHKNLRTELLVELLKQDDAAFRIEVLRALKDRGDAKATSSVLALARDTKQPTGVRAQAILTLSALHSEADFFIALTADTESTIQHEALRALTQMKLTPKQEETLLLGVKGKGDCDDLVKRILGKPVNADRPDVKNTTAWLKYLEGKADTDAGRRVFESPKLAGCYKCHRVEGRGADIGPDLSLIGRTERKWIVESILQPSAVVAPHYQAWRIETTDGRTRTGLLVGTHLDRSVYIDEKGNRFEVLAGDVADIRAAKNSIMPDGLLDGLTAQEIKDLIAYLAARK